MRRTVAIKRQTVNEPTINLTPLIDVVFVILIMFIVIAPLLEMDQVELAGTSSDAREGTSAVNESSPIAIYVRRDNTILFNERPVAQQQLTELLQQAKKKYPQARPQIFHDKQAFFGTYQTVKNAVEAAGFEQMDVVLKPL